MPTNRQILLIHGFNVSEDDAIISVDTFRDNLADLSRELSNQALIVTWPGDWPVPMLGALAYPRLVSVARRGASILLDAIQNRLERPDGPRELVIVAHSLGCRLTLELLNAMEARGRPANLRRMVVVLMAAAVPIHMDALMRSALGVADAIVVLHSLSDTVLRDVFPLGQTAAFEGWMPEAVGYRGLPIELGWWTTVHMRGYEHSDYWAHYEATSVICRILSQLLPGLAVRHPKPDRFQMPEHRLPTIAPLPEHISRWW